MKIPGGYILKARKTLINDVLSDGPPLYSKLWDWMLMQANWQDREKLQRGQFVTTTKDMQEAMSWKIGWRTYCPSRGKLRSAYEALTNNHMINHTRTTRGMIITICNYDFYQDPGNYEQPHEQPHEHTTNNQVTTYDTEEGEERKKGTNRYRSSFDDHFWPIYPRKVKKQTAYRAWKSLKPSEGVVTQIVDDIQARLSSKDWEVDKMEYIPHPTTYIHQRRWEDETKESHYDQFAFLKEVQNGQ